ncbi:cysteine desulfurase family protein [Shimia thalassica]|uniref:cysteine desulfurase family protein n=1 Tax=Shimia thalassica TaxID=1715693 RepID=UPI0027366B58|nr:cysteine desulfurase family protein [Shimia thalassica]MDP2495530.1 cysteine desulfurase family protein [Shimia thalassica]
MEIYLDNNATTTPLPQVVSAMAECLQKVYGNPSSSHQKGRQALRALDSARSKVAEFFGVDDDEVIFVSGATEANHAVLIDSFLKEDTFLITTAAEHPSAHGVFLGSQERIRFVPILKTGQIDLVKFEDEVAKHPNSLISIGWVNSETGIIQPVEELCRIARKFGATILIDGSQAAGRLPKSAFDFDYDYLSISAHKMNGPKGVGCLLVGENASPIFSLRGGGQERGYRSGTENIPAIVGFGVACEERSHTLSSDLKRMRKMRDAFEKTLSESGLNVQINGQHGDRVPSASNVLFPALDAMALVARCDASGVFFSQVSACSTSRPEPSKTLIAMGLSENDAYSSVRLSLSVLSNEAEIGKAAKLIINEAKGIAALLGGHE